MVGTVCIFVGGDGYHVIGIDISYRIRVRKDNGCIVLS